MRSLHVTPVGFHPVYLDAAVVFSTEIMSFEIFLAYNVFHDRVLGLAFLLCLFLTRKMSCISY